MNTVTQSRSLRFLSAGVALILATIGYMGWPVQAQDAANSKGTLMGGTINQIMQTMQRNAEEAVPHQNGLIILQGVYGADGSWLDVTEVLRSSVKQNTLNISWHQPYSEVGGDPAYGRIKTLLISYQIDGKSRLAVFQEKGEISELNATIP